MIYQAVIFYKTISFGDYQSSLLSLQHSSLSYIFALAIFLLVIFLFVRQHKPTDILSYANTELMKGAAKRYTMEERELSRKASRFLSSNMLLEVWSIIQRNPFTYGYVDKCQAFLHVEVSSPGILL